MIDVINLENEIDMDINNIYSKNNKVTKENVNKICPKCMDYCKCIDDIQYDINRKIKLSKDKFHKKNILILKKIIMVSTIIPIISVISTLV